MKLREFGFDSKLMSLIKRIYEGSEVKLMFQGFESKWFRTTEGVRQGCPLLREPGKIEISEYSSIYMVMNEENEVVYESCADFLYADDK